MVDSKQPHEVIDSLFKCERKRRNIQIHDVLDLFSPIADAELALLQLLGHFFLSVWVLYRQVLHVFHKTLNVTQSKKLGDEWLRRKSIKVREMFSCAQEDDGCLRCCDAKD
jgi:hypothetical protein